MERLLTKLEPALAAYLAAVAQWAPGDPLSALEAAKCAFADEVLIALVSIQALPQTSARPVKAGLRPPRPVRKVR